MKKAIILINAYTTRESELYQPRRLQEELMALGAQAEIKRNFFAAYLKDGDACVAFSADFCVYLDKDKYAGELLEKSGLRLFNRPAAVAACDDKMATFLALSSKDIPMPDTVPAPLCYSEEGRANEAFLKDVAQRLGYPVVVKECYGSLGRGVYLAKDFEELKGISEKLLKKPHLYQRFIAESAGRDLRILVIGGKYFSAMLRTSQGDFRSNVELGGRAEAFAPSDAAIALAEKAAATLGLDYCGVDLLFAKDGFTVCEVNSNAFFGGMERVTGKNVARAYAEYMLKTVQN